jgi:hypothetical protein
LGSIYVKELPKNPSFVGKKNEKIGLKKLVQPKSLIYITVFCGLLKMG